jgi:hypothetical protein
MAARFHAARKREPAWPERGDGRRLAPAPDRALPGGLQVPVGEALREPARPRPLDVDPATADFGDQQQRVDRQVPEDQAEERKGEHVDHALRADCVREQSQGERRQHDQCEPGPEPRRSHEALDEVRAVLEQLEEGLGAMHEELGLTAAVCSLRGARERAVGRARALVCREEEPFPIGLLERLDEQDAARVRLSHREG